MGKLAPGLTRLRRAALLGALAAVVFLPLLGRRPINDHEARVMFTALSMSDAGWPWDASRVNVRMPPPTPDKGPAGTVRRRGAVLSVNPWVVPVFQSQVRLQKPPLPYWCTATLFRLLGPDARWARVIPAAMGALATLLIFDLARLLLGRRRAWIAALAWVATYFVIDEFRKAMADPYLAFTSLAAVWAWVRASERRDAIETRSAHDGQAGALVAIFYFSCGLGLLAKGPVLLLHVIVPVVLYSLLYGRRRPGTWWAHALGAALMLAVALPWPLLVLRQVNGAIGLWWYESLGEYTVNRTNARSFYFYLPQLPLLALPWVVPWGIGAARAVPRGAGARAWRRRALAPAWLASVVLLFSLAHLKKNAYLLPVMPAQCLMVATGINALAAAHRRHRSRRAARWILTGQSALAMGFACAITVMLFVRLPGSRAVPVSEQALVGALAMLVGALPLLVRDGRAGRRLIVVQMSAFALLAALFIAVPGAALGRAHDENRLPARGTARLVYPGGVSYDPTP